MKRRRKLWLLIGSGALYAVAMAVFFYSANDASPETTGWPRLTMTYEIGESVASGGSPNEVHRLVYRSPTEWTDTVIEAAPTQTLGSGTVSKIDSYRQVFGTRVEDSNSIHDETTVKETEDAVLIPHPFLKPVDVSELKKADRLTPIRTTSIVCYLGACEQNAQGQTFTDDGAKWTIVDDSRFGIALSVGDAFRVREVRIEFARE